MKKLFSNIIEGIKLNYRYIKNMANDNNGKYFCMSEIINDSYIIRPNTQIISKNKSSVCLCALVDFGENFYVPCLYTDLIFEELSDKTKEFVIQHELGHFNLHKDIMLNNKKIKRNILLEFQADEYAKEQLGVKEAIDALIELKEALMKMNYGFSSAATKEIDLRINNLIM